MLIFLTKNTTWNLKDRWISIYPQLVVKTTEWHGTALQTVESQSLPFMKSNLCYFFFLNVFIRNSKVFAFLNNSHPLILYKEMKEAIEKI